MLVVDTPCLIATVFALFRWPDCIQQQVDRVVAEDCVWNGRCDANSVFELVDKLARQKMAANAHCLVRRLCRSTTDDNKLKVEKRQSQSFLRINEVHSIPADYMLNEYIPQRSSLLIKRSEVNGVCASSFSTMTNDF